MQPGSTQQQLIARLRAETPGVKHHIHFNNAGISLDSIIKYIVQLHRDYTRKDLVVYVGLLPQAR